MSVRLLCALLAAVLFPGNAAAQGIYIQGGALLDSLATSRVDSVPVTVFGSGVTYRWNDLNGDRRWQPGEEEAIVPNFTTVETRTSSSRFAPGASVGVGVFVTPSISFRVEGSFQGERVTTTEVVPHTLSTPGPNRHAVTITDVFVSAGWHQGESRRVAFTYLAGMVFRRERDETTLTSRIIAIPSVIGLPTSSPVSVTDEQTFGSTLYSAGIMAGLDAVLKLSPNIAIVPQFRIITANHDFSMRPAIAMRWRP